MALVEIAVHLSGDESDDVWQSEEAVMVYIMCTLLGSIRATVIIEPNAGCGCQFT